MDWQIANDILNSAKVPIVDTPCYNNIISWAQTLVSAITGFLGGLLVGVLIIRNTNKTAKTQKELEIYHEFEKRIEIIESANNFLENYVDEKSGVIPLDNEDRKKYYDIIVDVGTFFERLAFQYYNALVGKGVAEESVYEAIREFSLRCQTKGFRVSTFKDPQVGVPWNERWKHIGMYIRKKRAKWAVIKAWIFG
jgi:hypothetical protein